MKHFYIWKKNLIKLQDSVTVWATPEKTWILETIQTGPVMATKVP